MLLYDKGFYQNLLKNLPILPGEKVNFEEKAGFQAACTQFHYRLLKQIYQLQLL